ncbi:MAG: hypothetical protein PHI96_08380, partial [Desulfovibrio sp.]|nr:hypothetical protein [Desulfovibrio sp.]
MTGIPHTGDNPAPSGPVAEAPNHMRSRMAARNTHENTEEIIDLTELIEKGSVPEAADDVANQASGEDTDLHNHMRSLNDPAQHSEAEAEIDDLLAQMDSMGDAPNAEAAPQAGDAQKADNGQAGADTHIPSDFPPVRMPDGHIVDPHEELHMPGMGDVDNLLSSLDIPPQPRAQETAAPLPKDTDDAVDQMLGSLNSAPRSTPESVAHNGQDSIADTTVLDDLLAAGATPEPAISDELEALLNEARPTAAPQEVAPQKAA